MNTPFKKKAVIEDLVKLIVGLGGLVILMAVIFLIIGESKAQVVSSNPCASTTDFYNATENSCYNSSLPGLVNTSFNHAYNATNQVQEATSDIPMWLPIVVITIIGGILLVLVRTFKNQ